MKKNFDKNQIGIMSVAHEGRKPFGMQTYFFEDMVRSVNFDDCEMFFFSPLGWRKGDDQISGFNFINGEWIEANSEIPAIIYDRAFSSDEDQKLYIENVRSFLSDSDKTILNPFAFADLLNNKVKFHEFLHQNNIPTLSTYPIGAMERSDFFDGINTKKVYIKPTLGSKGEGIFVVENNANGYIIKDHLGDEDKAGSHYVLLEKLKTQIEQEERYFIQEEVKTILYNNAPFDIRVLVQNYGNKYEVTGKAMRIGRKNAITSNLNSGGNALPLEEAEDFFWENYMYSLEKLQLEIDRLCLECSEVLRKEIGEFCEIGFDILITKDQGPVILEGNAKPSRWVFVKMADYLELIGKDNSYYLDRRKETVSVPMIYANFLLKEMNQTINENEN